MLVLKGIRSEIIDLIDKSPNETQAFIKVKPSTFLLAYLLNNTKVKKIYCTSGIYKTFPKNILSALKKLSINVVERKVKQGRPFTILQSQIRAVEKMRRKGKDLTLICKELGISRRTYYYRINKV